MQTANVCSDKEDEVALQILSVQSLSNENWESQDKECSDDVNVSSDSLIFSSYLLDKVDTDVVLLPSHILREEIMSEKIRLWLKINKTKGKGRIYISEGPNSPYLDCLDVKDIPLDSDEYQDIPFNIKTLRPEFIPSVSDESSMWVAKLYKSHWTLVGFLQPDEKLPSAVENNESIVLDELLPTTQESSHRWWMMSTSDDFEYLVFLDFNIYVTRIQLDSLTQISNLKSSKSRAHRIQITENNSNVKLSYPYHTAFGIYGLPGLSKHFIIGPYGITQEPKINVLTKGASNPSVLKLLPFVCCGTRQCIKVNSRGVLSSTVVNFPTGCVKGYWLHSSKGHCEYDHDEEHKADITALQLEAVSSKENSSLKYHQNTSNYDKLHKTDVATPIKRCGPTPTERGKHTADQVISESISTCTKGLMKEYLVPNIEGLGCITVTVSPDKTFSIPHPKNPGVRQYFNSVKDIIKLVNGLIHTSIVAKSIQCKDLKGVKKACSCVIWQSVSPWRGLQGACTMNYNIFNGFHILTAQGLFDVRDLNEKGIEQFIGKDWKDWLSRGLNLAQYNEWQRKTEKEKVFFGYEELKALVRSQDLAIEPPVETVLGLAITEIRRLVVQEQLLCLERLSLKLIRKSLLSSFQNKYFGVPSEDSLAFLDDEDNSLHHQDKIAGSLNPFSDKRKGVEKQKQVKKGKEVQIKCYPGVPMGSRSVIQRQPTSLVHSMSPFSRLNISVEEGGIVHTASDKTISDNVSVKSLSISGNQGKIHIAASREDEKTLIGKVPQSARGSSSDVLVHDTSSETPNPSSSLAISSEALEDHPHLYNRTLYDLLIGREETVQSQGEKKSIPSDARKSNQQDSSDNGTITAKTLASSHLKPIKTTDNSHSSGGCVAISSDFTRVPAISNSSTTQDHKTNSLENVVDLPVASSQSQRTSTPSANLEGNITFSFQSPNDYVVLSSTEGKQVMSAAPLSSAGMNVQVSSAAHPRIPLPGSRQPPATTCSSIIPSPVSVINKKSEVKVVVSSSKGTDVGINLLTSTSVSTSFTHPGKFMQKIIMPVSTLNVPMSATTATNSNFCKKSPASGNILLSRSIRPAVVQPPHSNGKPSELFSSLIQAKSISKCVTSVTQSASPKPVYVVSAICNKTTLTGSSAYALNAAQAKEPSVVPRSKLKFIKMRGLKVPVVCSVVPTKVNSDTSVTVTTDGISETANSSSIPSRGETKTDASDAVLIDTKSDAVVVPAFKVSSALEPRGTIISSLEKVPQTSAKLEEHTNESCRDPNKFVSTSNSDEQ